MADNNVISPDVYDELKKKDLMNTGFNLLAGSGKPTDWDGWFIGPTGKLTYWTPGGFETTKQITAENSSGKYEVLPTIEYGIQYSPREAMSLLKNKKLGVYDTLEDADRAAREYSNLLGELTMQQLKRKP